jgi:DNA gyrase subunit A
MGGRIVGLDGIRDAYLTGRGTFRTRATAKVEKLTPRRIGDRRHRTALPRRPEKVSERIKTLVQGKKLQGISDIKDLTDRKHGLRLVIEIKNGFNPEAVLEQLYKLTPMEDSFGINNVALVDGQPRTLGLKELLRCFVDFRIEVVRRRTEYPAGQAQGSAPPGRGPAHRHPRHRRGHPAHPQPVTTPSAARTRLIEVFDLTPRPGRLHPRAAACAG